MPLRTQPLRSVGLQRSHVDQSGDAPLELVHPPREVDDVGELLARQLGHDAAYALQPASEDLLVLGQVQGARLRGPCGVQLVDAPQQPIDRRGAVFDQVITSIDQQLQLPRLLVVGRDRQVRLTQRGTGDRRRRADWLLSRVGWLENSENVFTTGFVCVINRPRRVDETIYTAYRRSMAETTTIRVSRDTHARVTRLAAERHETVDETVSRALRALRQDAIGQELATELADDDALWLDADAG